jgi:Raf kinase inhibitor-like YbhB/YbcL family protein
MVFHLESEAFVHGGEIPGLHTCRGSGVSPPLAWSDPPEKTRSFALTMEDSDTPVGTISHWVLFNIPASTRSLPARIPPLQQFPDGKVQGRNGMRRNRYMGPCPPWGTHRYTFRLYALDTLIAPEARTGKRRLERAMKGHILAHAELMGRYGSSRAAEDVRSGRKR